MQLLEQTANLHAQRVWGQPIARGHPFPVVDESRSLYAYVFPYLRGSHRFPSHKTLLAAVTDARTAYAALNAEQHVPEGFDAYFARTVGMFGSIYVSATRRNVPILRFEFEADGESVLVDAHEHPSNGQNVPNLLDEVHAPNNIDV